MVAVGGAILARVAVEGIPAIWVAVSAATSGETRRPDSTDAEGHHYGESYQCFARNLMEHSEPPPWTKFAPRVALSAEALGNASAGATSPITRPARLTRLDVVPTTVKTE
jgi:hypothetical protein